MGICKKMQRRHFPKLYPAAATVSHSRKSRFLTGKVTIVGFFSIKKLFFENLFTASTK